MNVADLVEVILAWGPCPLPLPPAGRSADLDESGVVDVNDLVMAIRD